MSLKKQSGNSSWFWGLRLWIHRPGRVIQFDIQEFHLHLEQANKLKKVVILEAKTFITPKFLVLETSFKLFTWVWLVLGPRLAAGPDVLSLGHGSMMSYSTPIGCAKKYINFFQTRFAYHPSKRDPKPFLRSWGTLRFDLWLSRNKRLKKVRGAASLTGRLFWTKEDLCVDPGDCTGLKFLFFELPGDTAPYLQIKSGVKEKEDKGKIGPCFNKVEKMQIKHLVWTFDSPECGFWLEQSTKKSILRHHRSTTAGTMCELSVLLSIHQHLARPFLKVFSQIDLKQ